MSKYHSPNIRVPTGSIRAPSLALEFSTSILEFCFAIAAHAHDAVVLSVFVLGTFSDGRAAAVAEQGTFAVFEFYNCMFVIHKMLRVEPILQERGK